MSSRHLPKEAKLHRNQASTVPIPGFRIESLGKPNVKPQGATKSWAEEGMFIRLYELTQIDRINLIRAGLDPAALKEMIQRMDLSQEKVLNYLDLPVATINRKIQRKELLSPADSAKVLGLASIIGQIQTMVERSGNPEGFDAAKWVAEWMERPLPALGGAMPAEYMDTTAGLTMVADLLAMMESGAYA